MVVTAEEPGDGDGLFVFATAWPYKYVHVQYTYTSKIGRNAHKERQLQFEEFDRSPPLSKQHKVN